MERYFVFKGKRADAVFFRFRIMLIFQFFDPSGRSFCFFKIKITGINNLLIINLRMKGFNNFRVRV